MTLEQYNQCLHAINKQIEELQQSREALITQNKEKIEKQIIKRQQDDRKWFVSNFDVFWNNKHKFNKNTANADIIVDFFNIYTRGNKAGSKSVRHISISDLITLWELGYKYQGYPIVEYISALVIYFTFEHFFHEYTIIQ